MLACEVISRPTKKQFDVPSAELTLLKGVISVEDATLSETTLILALRRVNVIKSFVGYSQTLNIRSVDQFLDCFSNSPYEGVMGSFYYYSNARLIESITDINWSIQIVPYEILEMDNQVDTFISRILNEETTQKKEYIKPQSINYLLY